MLTGVAPPTVVTLLMSMFSMVPPRVLALLNRIPAGTAPSTVSPLTSTLRMPPEVSLPMVTPAAPPRTVLSYILIFSVGRLTRRPSASRPALRQIASSLQSRSQCATSTSDEESISNPPELDIARFVDLHQPRPLAIVVHRPAQSLGLVFLAPHLPVLVPPDLAVAIYRALAADLHVGLLIHVDQR